MPAHPLRSTRGYGCRAKRLALAQKAERDTRNRQMRSTTIATPWPPPMHRVASP